MNINLDELLKEIGVLHMQVALLQRQLSALINENKSVASIAPDTKIAP